jgi:YggT family protein
VIIILFQILSLLIRVYEIILLLRVLLSWFQIDPYNPIVRILYTLTEPLLQPIRQILPPAGMMDFSPLVAFLLLFALQNALSILAASL